MKISHEEASDRMLGAIDRLVLYDVLMPRDTDSEEYDLHPSFASYLDTTTRLMENNPKQKEVIKSMLDYEFIRAILLPNYFTISKLVREKGLESPNSDIITFSYEEFKQRADKESFADLTSEQWAELNDMSFALCAYFVWVRKK